MASLENVESEKPAKNPNSSTYRYRDADKRRKYMRELMRKRRGGK